MLREWLEQGVNPWAEGRDEPQSTMAGGLEEASEEDENADKGGIKLTGDPYHDGGGGGGGGGDRVKQQLADMKHQAAVENAEGQQLIELFSLCRHGKYAEIEDLFDDPTFLLPIDAKDDLGNTLLMLACQNGNKRIVKLCLRRGANINTQNVRWAFFVCGLAPCARALRPLPRGSRSPLLLARALSRSLSPLATPSSPAKQGCTSATRTTRRNSRSTS